jgi:hypothetical protein
MRYYTFQIKMRTTAEFYVLFLKLLLAWLENKLFLHGYSSDQMNKEPFFIK